MLSTVSQHRSHRAKSLRIRDSRQGVSQLDAVVEALQQGVDVERNFRRLFDHFYEPLDRFFARRVNAAEDRRDLVQETFLRVHRGIGSFRRESRLATWVFRIAHNTWCRWVRRQKHADIPLGEGVSSEMILEDWLIDPEADPLADTLEVEKRTLLWRFVGRLPPQMRRCTVLRVRQGLSTGEIANLLALSPQTVKVHLHSARKKLQTMAWDAEVA